MPFQGTQICGLLTYFLYHVELLNGYNSSLTWTLLIFNNPNYRMMATCVGICGFRELYNKIGVVIGNRFVYHTPNLGCYFNT